MSVEEDLLARIVNADEDAFREIYDLYVKKVYQFISTYIKDRTEAEDITQNVFIKIWEKRNSIDLNNSFEGFLFTIAYRSVMDCFRQNNAKLHKTISNSFIPDSCISSSNTDDLLNRHQFESLYQKALQSLPPRRKEIFRLSRHCGLSNKQIAVKLQISIKTVENQMTVALSTMKEFFTHSDFLVVIFIILFIQLG